MPELPEVETVVRTLRQCVLNGVIERVAVHRTDVLSPPDCAFDRRLKDRRIAAIERRGKRIIFTLDDENRFYVHLGMTGRLTIEPPGSAAAMPDHVHMEFWGQTNKRSFHVRFRDPRRFGGIFWLGSDRAADQNMGPEPLAITAKQFHRLLSRTSRAIKIALLDQKLIAGIGNIYADEALFRAAIHPQTPANGLSDEQSRRLCQAIKQTLRQAIEHRGSTLRDYRDANGSPGDFQSLHRVYQRDGCPCPRCKTVLEKMVLGGRSTHFCPACQPACQVRSGHA